MVAEPLLDVVIVAVVEYPVEAEAEPLVELLVDALDEVEVVLPDHEVWATALDVPLAVYLE